MSGHTHQKWQYHFEETFDNYQRGKVNSILYVFHEILQRYYKVVVLGASAMPGHAHPKWYYQFVENFCVYLQVKNQFPSPCFSGDTSKYANLFWVLWACLVMLENFDVYLHAKRKVHHSLLRWDITFYRTLQFYWLTTFEPITGDPEFCQIWGWCWNINKNTSIHFRLLPRKSNDKIFQKIQNTLFWGHVNILAFFAQIWAKMNFPGKKALSVFKYSNYLPSYQKSEKTNMSFVKKMLNWRMDGQTERRIDRQAWLCRALCKMGVQLLK